MTPNIFEPVRNPPVRRKRKSAASPAALEVLVTSVVLVADGAARIGFSAPVTLTAGDPGDTIFFDSEGRSGFAHILAQDGPDGIVAAVDGLPLTTGAAWEISAVPPCFQLPDGASMPVPQSGTVE